MSKIRIKQISEFGVTSPNQGDYLAYNSTSGQFENQPAPLDGTSGSSGTSGIGGNSFFYNYTTTSPAILTQGEATTNRTQTGLRQQ